MIKIEKCNVYYCIATNRKVRNTLLMYIYGIFSGSKLGYSSVNTGEVRVWIGATKALSAPYSRFGTKITKGEHFYKYFFKTLVL